MNRPLAIAAILAVPLAVAACNQTASAPPAQAPISAAAPVAGGSGCAVEIAQFRAVLKNDVDTGNVGQSVYNRATADLTRADGACAAGRDGEARSVVASTKSRYGYR